MTVRIVIANAFSVNMLPSGTEVHELRFVKIPLELAREIVKYAHEKGIEILSIIGHESTAKLLTQLLGVDVPVNRTQYTLRQGDLLLVFTVPVRLPEGRVLSEDELKEYADKLNIFAVTEITVTEPECGCACRALEPVYSFLRELADYLRKKGMKEHAHIIDNIRIG